VSAAAKRTVLAAVSVLAITTLAIVGPAGGASSDRRDRQAPTTPSNLRVTGATSSLVSVAWDPSTDDVGVEGYYVFGDKGKATVNKPEHIDKPEYTVTELRCGETARLTVIAFDAAQNRSEKATLTVATAACPDTQPPSAPTGFVQLATTRDAVVLGWNPSSDNTGVVEYGVYRNTLRVSTAAEPNVTLSGLACGLTSQYLVDAADAAGNRSLQSNVYVRTAACAPGDSTPPSMPAGLAASGITSTALSLSWNASSDNVGVAGYDVYRNGTKVAAPTTTSVSQSGLTCGTAYTLGVAARDAAGNVSQRAQRSVSTSACSSSPPPGDSTPPSTPTGLAVSGATSTSVSLRWSASTDNVGVAVYRVYSNSAYATTTSQLSATVAGLACGSAYAFEVDAVDLEGNNSARASVTGSTAACPDQEAPSAPQSLVASSRTTTSIALSWFASNDNVGVVGYGLYRAGVQVGASNTTTGIFSGLTCNTNYTLAVDASDGAGNRSSKSTVMVATTACPDTQPPSAPTGLVATNVTQTGLTLTWNQPSDNVGVTAYDVLRNGTKVATPTGTSASQSGLGCGTGYAFAVVAKDAAGNSSAPAQLNTTTAACLVSGNSFYVDPTGSDSGAGSPTNPWKTLAKACSSVPPNAGVTIVMRAGNYVESSICNLPPGTNIQGAGGRNGVTTIKGSADPLISLVNASGAANVQTVSGIKLDGQNRTAGTRGMKVENVRGLTIRDMLGEGFKGADAGGALDLNQVWNADVGDSIFRNSAGIFPTFAAGSLGIRNATDSVFHDLIASDDKALGIKGGWLGATLTNVEFYNLRVTCGSPTVSTGGGTTWPAISFEMNNMSVTNVTIRNSYFNATLSLTAPDSVGQLPSGQWRYKIYNNHFDIPSQSETGELQYALELHNHSSDVHHNYFDGGVNPISEFGSMPHRGNRVHHNVFANGENYAGLMRVKPGLFDFEFYKNTFVWNQGWINMLFLANELTQSSNPNIHDNIFMSTSALGDVLGPGLGSATVNRNVFYNLAPRGTNVLTSDPQLPLSGGFPNAYIPSSGSPAGSYGAFADGSWSGVGPS
jgi:chitodextrinase